MKRAAAIHRLGLSVFSRPFVVLLSVLAIAFAAGCGDGNGTELRVRVVTGLVPGPEFNRTETLIMRPQASGDAIAQRAESVAHFGMAFARGVEVANFPNAPTGDVLILVRAFTPQGDVLLEQRLRTELTGNRTVTLFLDRACIAVTCPSPGGSANLNACLAGQCVDPRCDPTDESTREFCPNVTFCNLPSECSPVADCAEQLCIEGVCVTEQLAAGTSDEACEDGLWCNPVGGDEACAPVPDSTLAQDAGADAAVCGTICFAPGDPCSIGYWACDGDAGPVCAGFVFMPSGTSCGNGGTCDSAGLCVGASDGGAGEDAGNDVDGGTGEDASVSADASADIDASAGEDASVPADAFVGMDAAIDTGVDAAIDASPDASEPVTLNFLKGERSAENDLFGWQVAISGDGQTLAVGSPFENDTKPCGGRCGPRTPVGVVYVFTKSGDEWTLEERLEPTRLRTDDTFGSSLSLSFDGDTLAVGAPGDDSSHRGRSRADEYELSLGRQGFLGVQLPTGERVYVRSLVAHVNDDGALVDANGFRIEPVISVPGGSTDLTFAEDGNVSCTIGGDVVQLGQLTAYDFDDANELERLNGYYDLYFRETALSGSPYTGTPSSGDYGALSVGIVELDDLARDSGAAYVFRRTGSDWSEGAYVKPNNTRASARFGAAVSLSHDGTRLAVGAPGEDSAQSNTARIMATPFALEGDGFFAVQLPDGNTAYTRSSDFVVDNTGTIRTPEGFALMPMLVIEENASDLRVSFNGEVSVYSPTASARQTIGAITVALFTQPDELRPLSARLSHFLLETAESGVAVTSTPNSSGAGSVYVRDAFDTSVENAGAAYVFDYDADVWTQSSYAKANAASSGAAFGTSVALGSDGNTLVVGAPYESPTTPVTETDVLPSIEIDGAGYFMVRLLDGNTGYTKNNDFSIDVDGTLLLSGLPLTNGMSVPPESTSIRVTLLGVVEAFVDGSPDPMQIGQLELANFSNPAGLQNEGGGIFTETPESNPPLVSQPGSSGLGFIYTETATETLDEVGAAYVFVANGRGVPFSAPLRITDEDAAEAAYFGYSVAISDTDIDDGTPSFIAVGAPGANTDAGAVNVYSLRGMSLNYDAFIDATNTESGDLFGSSVAFGGRGGRLLVGAPGEDSAATLTDGDGGDNSASESGAAYVFAQDGVWFQAQYIKGFVSDAGDNFGYSVCLDNAGMTYAIGAPYEDSSPRDIPSVPEDNSVPNAGAVVVDSLRLDF